MTDKKTINLKYPIPVPKEGGGIVEVSNITFGRLKLKHLKLLPKDFIENGGQGIDPASIIPLVAGITEMPEDSIGEIDLEDLEDIAGIISSFFSEPPKTITK